MKFLFGILLSFFTACFWWYGLRGFYGSWVRFSEDSGGVDAFGNPKAIRKLRLVFIYALLAVLGVYLIKWSVGLLNL